MVENLVSSYKCPYCSSNEISEKHIDIVWAAGNTVNIDMHCPSCDKHFMAKTEVMQMDLGNISSDKLAELQKSLLALKGKLGGNIEIETEIHSKNEESIKDENITALRESMKKDNFDIKDLFWE